MNDIKIIRNQNDIKSINLDDIAIFGMDAEKFLDSLPEEPIRTRIALQVCCSRSMSGQRKVNLEYLQYSIEK